MNKPTKPKLHLDLQNVTKNKSVPSFYRFKQWTLAALPQDMPETELTIRIVGEKESAHLNETYRAKKGPTNVLSFPFEPPSEMFFPLLGDIIICARLIEKEAKEQCKNRVAHWAHIVVHGVLHLLGYDHINERDAKKMEKKEISILNNLGFPNPYLDLFYE